MLHPSLGGMGNNYPRCGSLPNVNAMSQQQDKVCQFLVFLSTNNCFAIFPITVISPPVQILQATKVQGSFQSIKKNVCDLGLLHLNIAEFVPTSIDLIAM